MTTIDLRLGDCLEILPTLADGSVDAVITDPPYKLSSGGNTNTGLNKGFKKAWGYTNSGDLFIVPEFDSWMPLVEKVCYENADFYTMTNDKNLEDMLRSARLSGFKLHNVIVWDKKRKIPNRWYMKQSEFILYLWKGKAKTINSPNSSNIIKLEFNGTKLHPSEKPTNLFCWLIKNSTNLGDTILDPFMGSGTTGVACVQTGRNFIGIEIEPKYYEIAEKRIKEAQRQMIMDI